MIKISHLMETNNLELPKEVVTVIKEIATILDNEYREYRDVDEGDGGYILVIESESDFSKLKEIYLDINDLIPEYVDKINVTGKEDWVNVLIICNSDFVISLIMPISIASAYLIDEIDEV
ncbi:hypothetical protein SAMN05660297_03348 [Natronincola peptidivorans]|uniref:Uncharacterized protein n=1 Tax=Natronincola peptidivorans TaxID=426128 RepID=A0A1I0GSU4_9FIRM|nr:hypothetical protein [Natronincola peptidivorans]SET74401.1 hypothetical protein SAMN05660297_03348 [Natronincola peptidivorans]